MYIFIKLSQFFLRLCPISILAFLFHKILSLKAYRKQIIKNNYKFTIGDGNSQNKFKPFYNKCLKNLSRIAAETLKFNKSKATNLIYNGINNLEDACIKQNGLILMASHYGNWELACINLPLHTDIPCYGVYKPLKNKPLDKELLKLRSKFGLNLVPMNTIARIIATNKSKGVAAIYILIADQNPRSIRNVVWEDFLGVKTAFSNGLEKLHTKYTLAIGYMKITPEQGYYNYKIDFEYPSSEDKKEPIIWYSKRLEKQINTVPHYWLWSHKRWKRKFVP
jgi:KDO2-lipid IV(A) lauroyltransferase